MPAIEVRQRTVYRAPSRGRTFLTAKAAARSEAATMLSRKYAAERPEYDDIGRMTYPGFHWSADEHLVRVHARLVRLILKRLKESQ